MDVSTTQLKLEVLGGTALAAVPIWVSYIQEINVIAACFASICGAILGLAAVYRLRKRSTLTIWQMVLMILGMGSAD